MSYNEIIANNYDVVITEMAQFSPSNPTLLNNLFNASVNLVTQGNDSNTSLSIIKSYVNLNSDADFSAIRVVKNEVTENISLFNQRLDSFQNFIKFVDDVEVWLQFDYNGTIYDAIGYLERNDTRWLHLQPWLRDSNLSDADYLSIVYRVSGKKSTNYIVDGPGEYCFKAYDLSGNVSSKCITV